MAIHTLKQPVTVAGVEFDALIEEERTLTATAPAYPVEEGFPVADTVIPDPITVHMILYVTNTPVTWHSKHPVSKSRVKDVCNNIQKKFLERKKIKIVTSDTTYTNMILTECSILKSQETGYSRQITITAQKITTTKKKTATVPKLKTKSGSSKTSAGKAKTSSSSSKTSAKTSGTTTTKSGSTSSKSSSNNSKSTSTAKKSSSILYGLLKK